MAFVTYYTAAPAWVPATDRRRLVARVHATQAAANARAATTAGVTAYVGAVSDDVDLGWWLTATGAGAGTVTAVAPALSDVVRRRRAAARQVHAALEGWTVALAAEGVVHAAAVVAVGHDYLRSAHQAVYIMAHRGAIGIASWEAWCAAMAQGASDVTSPREFFERMEAGSGLHAPTGPCAWVRWGHRQSEGYTTPIRVPLADAIAASGVPGPTTPGRLHLQASDLPGGGLHADGTWIDTITA